MSDYAEVTRDWTPVDDAMRQAYAEREQPGVYLPELRPTAPVVVHQPAPLPEQVQTGLIDRGSMRLFASGFCGLGCGGGVFLACEGIHEAGPYLIPFAIAVGAVGGLVALIKGQSAGSGGTSITISGGKNKFGRIG